MTVKSHRLPGWIALAAAAAVIAANAADIVLTPPAGGGVSITNASGTTPRFRVAEDGAVTLPGVTAAAQPATGLCVDNATLKVGTCSLGGGGTITGVTALAPLASSGGSTPEISLTGIVPVAKGGTGANGFGYGVLMGNGGGAISTSVGYPGQMLVHTPGYPVWTYSPEILGSYVLPAVSTADAGNIMKEGNRFLHNFGTGNAFFGVNAGNFTMNGSANTASGHQALSGNTSGDNNAAFGHSALMTNTSGTGNTALGSASMGGNISGQDNTAVGALALGYATGASYNTAVGSWALVNATGSNNVALGNGAGSSLGSGSSNIIIGNTGESADSDTIRIGTATEQQRAFIAGIRGVLTDMADGVPVFIDSSGQLGTGSAYRQQGEFQFAGGTAGVNVKTINFPIAFGSPPKVVVTARTDDFGGVPVNDTIVASVRSVSTSEFQVNVFRVDVASGSWNVNTRLAWIAWQ